MVLHVDLFDSPLPEMFAAGLDDHQPIIAQALAVASAFRKRRAPGVFDAADVEREADLPDGIDRGGSVVPVANRFVAAGRQCYDAPAPLQNRILLQIPPRHLAADRDRVVAIRGVQHPLAISLLHDVVAERLDEVAVGLVTSDPTAGKLPDSALGEVVHDAIADHRVVGNRG